MVQNQGQVTGTVPDALLAVGDETASRAWEMGDYSLVFTAEQAGRRTMRYIWWLREHMGWVPYVVENRSTVVVPALGIRCVPIPRSRSTPAQPSQAESARWEPCGGRFF